MANQPINKTFEEILKESGPIAKMKNDVYALLIDNLKGKVLPSFSTACLKYEIKNCYIKTSKPALTCCKKQQSGDRIFFAVCIENSTGLIMDAVINEETGLYEKSEERFCFADAPLSRSGAIDFYNVLKNRLNDYNERFTININNALNVIKEIEET